MEPTIPSTETAEVIETFEWPESLNPAQVTTLEVHEEPEAELEAATMVIKLQQGALGFHLLPWSEKTTAVRVKQLHRDLLMHWLELGAYLLRAKLRLGERFWTWFGSQGFGFGRKWAYQAIQSARNVLENPDLAKLVKKMQSIEHYRLVAKRLCTPEGTVEFQERGTVFGREIESLDQMSKRELRQLAQGEHEDEQLNLLPLQEVANQRDKALKDLSELKGKLAERNEELLQTRSRLTALENPHLNVSDLKKGFLERMEATKGRVMTDLEMLRPGARKDLDALDDGAIVLLYATLNLFERQLHLVMREVEARFGGRLPELLQNPEGGQRDMMNRAELRFVAEVARQTYDAVNKGFQGQKLHVITEEGEVIHS